MLFNSLEYIIFLPIVFTIYFVLPKKCRPYVLLVASLFFYMMWNWYLVFLIIGTILIAYFAALIIKKYESKKIRLSALIISLVLIVGALILFKYINLILETVSNVINAINHNNDSNLFLNILLPVGISFYTFQTVSYVVDVYKGKIEPERNFIYFSLYVSFFPQLVAGPIERPENLLPQLRNEESINIENIQQGLRYMLIGFVKKVAIADFIAVYVDKIYGNLGAANGPLVLIGTVLFAVQILCDFSGYSDIAVGTALLFNIKLMKNFDHPYRSGSIKEFWARWHISFSSWLKDYIYIPLGGSRVKWYRYILNIFIVFFISGLWHGADYTFIVWGMSFFILSLLDHYLRLLFKNKNIQIPRWIAVPGIFLIVCLCWVSFRSNNLNDMLLAYKLLFSGWGNAIDIYSFLGLKVWIIIYVVLMIGSLFFIDKIVEEHDQNNMVVYVLRKGAYLVLIGLVVFSFIYLKNIDAAGAFIYFQF